ncbi:hypothetical protein M758_6G084900 [Ceratodon purpureus]|nr:hypothetical protein M758_6G084900 [Ceratodon purpureus]
MAEKIRNTLEQEMVFFARLVGGFQVADNIIPSRWTILICDSSRGGSFQSDLSLCRKRFISRRVTFYLLQIGIVTVHNLVSTQASCTGFRKLEL